MSVVGAFLRRDFLIWSSYRLAVFWQVLGVLLLGGLVYFVGVTLGDGQPIGGRRSASFIAFAFSGIAITDVVMQAMYSVPQAIRENQKAGTLEPMLLTPIGAIALLLSSSAFKFALALGRMLCYFAVGWVLLGFWHDTNPGAVLIVLVPGVAVFAALGSLSAAFVVLVKQGDPVLIAYAAVTAMLSGVFFPIDALPAWVQPLSALVPLTYVLASARAGLDGAPISQVLASAFLLAALAAVLLPLGVVACNWAVDRAKAEGSLGQY